MSVEVIKCKCCGSEKVQALTEDKYQCLACDTIFSVYDRSKEFRQTDEHITSMHQDLKEDISKISTQNYQNLREDLGRMSDRNYLDEQATLNKAEGHMRNGNFTQAYDFFYQVATDYPQSSAGWYGMYRALTGEFTQVDRYARFVCGGNYIDLQEGEDEVYFEGNVYIKNALACEDADGAKMKREVTQFIKRCAEYGKKDIEECILALKDIFKKSMSEKSNQKELIAKGKRKAQGKILAPLLLIVVLIFLAVMYFFAAGDLLGKLLGVGAVILILKFGGKTIINRIRIANATGKQWDNSWVQTATDLIDQMDNQVLTLRMYCTDLDNYNQVLNDVEDEDRFIQKYINNPLEGLYSYPCSKEDSEDFVFHFLRGQIERYRYLVIDDLNNPDISEPGRSYPMQALGVLGAAAGLLGVGAKSIMEKTDNGAKIAEGAKSLTGKLKNLAAGESFTNGLTNLPGDLPGSQGGGKGEQVRSGTRFCTACGSPVEEDAVFCTICGTKIE